MSRPAGEDGDAFHLVDAGVVLAVKETAASATRSAEHISRRQRGRAVAVWMLDRTLRPGSRLEDGGGVLVAEIEDGRCSRP